MHHVYNVRILMRKYNSNQFYNTHIFILIPIIVVYDYLSSSSYLHINIFVIIGFNYPVEGKEGGGGDGMVDIPGNSWWGCAARFSKCWGYFWPKNVIFPTRFQTWPPRNYLDKNSNKKDFLKAFLNSHTSLSFLFIWNRNDKCVHTVL